MLKKVTIYFILLLLYGCMPSQELINLNDSDRLISFNRKIKNKRVRIELINGKEIKSKEIKFSSDSLFCGNSLLKSVPAGSIRFIVVSPKIATSAIIAGTLLGVGTYSILTARKSRGWKNLCPKCPGIAVVGLGTAVLVVGDTIESDLYYFNRKTH